MCLSAVIVVTSQGEGDGDNRSTKLRGRRPSFLQLTEDPPMRTTSHPIFPLNIDSLRPLHIFRVIGAAQARPRSRAESPTSADPPSIRPHSSDLSPIVTARSF